MKLTYTACKEGIYYPDLLPSNTSTQPIGMWGRKRLNYLKANRKELYVALKVEGRLFDHLLEVDQSAEVMFEDIASRLAKSNGATEALKATNQMRWVGIVSNARQSAEEIVTAELIYS